MCRQFLLKCWRTWADVCRQGGAVLRAEIARLEPVTKAGGFIPSCDHGIPNDVSWPNFVEHCRLLAKATGWT